MPDLPIAIIKHPLGGESAESVKQRSRDALDQIINGLTRELA